MRNTQSLLIDGAVGKLEALLDPVESLRPRYAGVVCHPHPLHEGSMHNKVAYMLARSLNQSGIAALRFNFRGVGASAGCYDNGAGEIDDAQKALQWMQEHYASAKPILTGFSFGAQVSLNAALHSPVSALVSVAPPVQRFEPSFKPDPICPWLVVQGTEDELVDARQVEEWATGLPSAPTLVIMPDTDHFFHGKLNDLRGVVCSFLDSALEA
ncbi:MAG: alpha/beta fold hydrolase [Gammaproteobacteria bacterium]